MWIPYPSRSEDQDVRLVGIDSSVPTKIYQEYVYRNSMLFLSTSVAELDQIRVEMKFRVTRRNGSKRTSSSSRIRMAMWSRAHVSGFEATPSAAPMRPR